MGIFLLRELPIRFNLKVEAIPNSPCYMVHMIWSIHNDQFYISVLYEHDKLSLIMFHLTIVYRASAKRASWTNTNLSISLDSIFWGLSELVLETSSWRHMTEKNVFKWSIKSRFYENLVETHSRLFFELVWNWTIRIHFD